jgi:hypothetical protein
MIRMPEFLSRRGWLAGMGSGGLTWLSRDLKGQPVWAAGQPGTEWVSVRGAEYGARGDGRANDGPGIQAAHDDIVRSRRRGVLYLPAGIYRIGAGLHFDASFVSLVSDGAVLSAAALSSGAALTVSGTAVPPYDQSLTSLSGLKVVGPGRHVDVTGLRFNRVPLEPSSSAGPSHLTVRNCNVSGFRTGLSFENYCYNLDLYSCDAYDCGTCISLPGGTIDGGERIIFHGGTFFNSELAVESGNGNSMLSLIGTSLDYNERQLVIDQAHVTLTNCHVEAGDHASTPITVRGNGGSLHVLGGWFVLTGDSPRKVPAIIECTMDPDSAGGVSFQGTFLSNLMTRAADSRGPRFAVGPGPVRLMGIHSYGISQNPRILADSQNRLRDGGFQREIPPDPVLISDIVPITDRCSGTNLALSTTTWLSSSSNRRALRCQKHGAAGTPAGFAFIVPVHPGQIADFELQYLSPASGGRCFYVSHGYGVSSLSGAGIPTLLERTTCGATREPLGEHAGSWVRVGSGEPTRRAPAWATCFFVELNLVDFSGGDIYLADAIVTVIE